MRIVLAVAVLSGLLGWEAWRGYVYHRIEVLVERLPALMLEITVDLARWQAAAQAMALTAAEMERALYLLAGAFTGQGVPVTDEYRGRGEELDALEEVLEEQRQRIRQIGATT